jgi:hypothetical protein
MPFITLNGYTVKVVNGGAGRGLTRRGAKSRTYLGQAGDRTRGTRREWSLRTCITQHEEAETLINLINGVGHLAYFRRGFDCNRTGLQPEIGFLENSRFDRTLTPFPDFDGGSLRTDADQFVARYRANLGREWTLLWYETEGLLGSWRQHVKRSDGAAWRDGVRDDSLWETFDGNFLFDVRAGNVELVGQGGDVIGVHHLAMLPYKAADAVIEQWGVNTKPWGALPSLRMEGDLIVTDFEFVQGEVVDVQYAQAGDLDGDFGPLNNDSQIINFLLTERTRAFTSDATSERPTPLGVIVSGN